MFTVNISLITPYIIPRLVSGYIKLGVLEKTERLLPSFLSSLSPSLLTGSGLKTSGKIVEFTDA
jgi:hypothetical protein